MEEKKRAYFVGLDLSIHGVGWCCVDEDGKLIRHGQHHLIGTALFDAAQTARKRRAYRSRRRRYARIRRRIRLLQRLMAPEIMKVDESFFIRLGESWKQPDDRTKDNLYRTLPEYLFLDGTEKVRDTACGRQSLPIYRIRAKLMQAEGPADIRYIYLALSHILRHRGHFLYEGKTKASIDEDASASLRFLLEALFLMHSAEHKEGGTFWAEEEKVLEALSALRDFSKEPSAQSEAAARALSVGKEMARPVRAAMDLICGGTVRMKELFRLDGVEGAREQGRIHLQMEEFIGHNMDEVLLEKGFTALQENPQFLDILIAIQDVHAWRMFQFQLSGGVRLSERMDRLHEKHREDLKLLKAWFRKYLPKEYHGFFHDDTRARNYNAYVGVHTDAAGYRGDSWKRCTQEEFYQEVLRCLSLCKDEDGQRVAKEIRLRMMDARGVFYQNGFMPIQRIFFNRSIPNDQQLADMDAIIRNQGRFYPSLLENREKLLSLCSFRLPFYVGPLHQDEKSNFTPWIVRKEPGEVTPWNFEEKVDVEKTARAFTDGLTNFCTYLPGEPVLPRHSLLYEEFELLNQLNRVRVNGKLIKQPVRRKLLREVFCRQRVVTVNEVRKWMEAEGTYGDRVVLTTSNGRLLRKFDTGLTTLVSFQEILGRDILPDDPLIPDIERIVEYLTAIPDRRMVRRMIFRDFREKFTERELDVICSLQIHGWGVLSRKFLDGITGNYHGEDRTIMEILRSSHENLMKIYYKKKYGIRKKVEAMRQTSDREEGISYRDVAELPGAPSTRRAIWRSVRILRELEDYMGCPPQGIYLRNSRYDNARRRSDNRSEQVRYDRLRVYYQSFEESTGIRISDKLKDQLKTCKGNVSDLEYLYFSQMGRCMYSGQELPFENLESCIVDAIIPQSLLADSSMDNQVVVLPGAQRARRREPLSDEIIGRMAKYWHLLCAHALISGQKLSYLLTRVYDDQLLHHFLLRESLDTTRMASRMTDLLKRYHLGSHVYAINSQLTNRFRDVYQLYRIPELGDTAQGFDAFLAAHIGAFADRFLPNVTDESMESRMLLTQWERGENRQGEKNTTEKNGLIVAAYNRDQEIAGEDGEQVKIYPAEERKRYLKKAYGFRDGYVTYMTQENDGAFYRETMYRAGDHLIAASRDRDPEKYGGHRTAYTGRIAAIRYVRTKKPDQEIKELINIPVYVAAKAKQDPAAIEQYLREIGFTKERGYEKVALVRDHIPLNQEILYGGHPYYLRSASELVTAKQLYIPVKYAGLISRIMTLPPDEIQHRAEDEHQHTVTAEDVTELLQLCMDKLKQEFPVYPSLLDDIETQRDRLPALSIRDQAIVIRGLICAMSTKGNRVRPIFKEMSEELIRSDNRLTERRITGETITLVHRSVTGLWMNTETI